MRLEDLTFQEVAQLAPRRVLIFAVGATEQHGPHLPLGTNSILTEALAGSLAQFRSHDVLLAPYLRYGSSEEHSSFMGTLSLSKSLLQDMLLELGLAASGFKGVGFMTANGGNAEVIQRVVDKLGLGGRRVFSWWPTPRVLTQAALKWSGPGVVPGLETPDLHAGRTETSAMLALDAKIVRTDKLAQGAIGSPTEILYALQKGGVESIASNGILGDPRGSSPAEGSAILGAFTQSLLESFDDFITELAKD